MLCNVARISAGSPLAQLREALNAPLDDLRGHLLFNGDLQLDYGGALGGRWYFLPHAWFTAYIPFYKARLSNVCFVDRTGTTAPADSACAICSLRLSVILLPNLVMVLI